jgi:hypothetical protein
MVYCWIMEGVCCSRLFALLRNSKEQECQENQTIEKLEVSNDTGVVESVGLAIGQVACPSEN